MYLRTILLPVVLISGLTACNSQPTEIGPGARDRGDPTAAATPSAPVKLPPSIAASKQYRCSDNSLAFVEFYSDDLSASMRTEKTGPATRVVAPAVGEAMVGEGFSLKGGKADEKITITTPGHPRPLSCHV